MNNKSDKKRKHKQKQSKTKKKKTKTIQSKKKNGGTPRSSTYLYSNFMTLSKVPLLSESNRLANEPRANSRILSPNASQTQPPPPPPRPPNAQPSGTNTIISISRCSIL